jgi:hypothetical protein
VTQQSTLYAQPPQPMDARASSRANIKLFASGTAGIALLLFVYYAQTWRHFAGFQAAIDTCGEPFCDFATFYYPMGEAIFRTGVPLKGFVYSPFIAILLAVFPPLGLHASLVLWGILQAFSIILYFLIFRWLVPARLPIQLLFVALALSSFPLLHTLTWGQVSIFTTVTVLGTLVFYERGQRAVAAALLAFGLSFKFFPIIFLVPFAIRRDIRFLLFAAAACVTFLFVVPYIFLGGGDLLKFYSALLDSYCNFDWVITNYNSQHFPHVILRLTKAAGYDARAILPLLRWIAYGVMAASVGLLFLVQRARLPLANLWSFHILFLSIPFILQTSWPVDLVYIPFGQALLAWQLVDGEKAAPEIVIAQRRSPTAKATAVLLLLVSAIVSNIVFFNLLGDRLKYGSLGLIFWANSLLLVATYMELLPNALRQIHTTPIGDIQPKIQAGLK